MRRWLSLMVIVMLFVSCDKRYEDGPCISFVKAENRLCGLWQISGLFRDGQDIYTAATVDTLRLYKISIFRNIDRAFFVSVLDVSEMVIAESIIRHDDRMTMLTFDLTNIAGYEAQWESLIRNCPPLGTEHTWTISRLKKEEMWLDVPHENLENRLYLELISDYQNL